MERATIVNWIRKRPPGLRQRGVTISPKITLPKHPGIISRICKTVLNNNCWKKFLTLPKAHCIGQRNLQISHQWYKMILSHQTSVARLICNLKIKTTKNRPIMIICNLKRRNLSCTQSMMNKPTILTQINREGKFKNVTPLRPTLK